MIFDENPQFPKGFFCASTNCGLKKEAKDLSVFYADSICNAAGVFTKNQFPGAPIVIGRKILKKGNLQAIVANSKISNVGTGDRGIENAKKMSRFVADEFNINANEVIASSTGVVGVQLPIELLGKGINGISKELTTDPIVGVRGMMTTDTYPKALSISSNNYTLTIVAKGSGMIQPNMATMLVYIFTDADIKANKLKSMLKKAVDLSFNMLSVDTDTSTSDTCIIMANGKAGKVDENDFSKTLTKACIKMAKMLARDGEGATKLLTAHVDGAKNKREAILIAKSIINSPLIKTMAYGGDPNIGRILMAIGKCEECKIIPQKILVKINEAVVFKDNIKSDFDESNIRKSLESDEVNIYVDLNIGKSTATAFGCDLTEGYIKENAAYYSS